MQAKLVVGSVDDPLEREADRVADRVMRAPEPVRTDVSYAPLAWKQNIGESRENAASSRLAWRLTCGVLKRSGCRARFTFIPGTIALK